jgi:protein gp37
MARTDPIVRQYFRDPQVLGATRVGTAVTMQLAFYSYKSRYSAYALRQPLRLKKSTMCLVISMNDLFQEGAPDDFIDQLFEVPPSPCQSKRIIHCLIPMTLTRVLDTIY